MQESAHYHRQADSVMRLAARASSYEEREVIRSIARGWRKLAVEASRNEKKAKAETRSFDPK